MKYVIKRGDGVYATGSYTWTRDRSKAFVFTPLEFTTARQWARGHAKHIRENEPGGTVIRVVKLVPKKPQETPANARADEYGPAERQS